MISLLSLMASRSLHSRHVHDGGDSQVEEADPKTMQHSTNGSSASTQPLSVNVSQDEESVADLIKRLAAINMTLEILEKTMIGGDLKTLRKKTTNPKSANRIKILCAHWKETCLGLMQACTLPSISTYLYLF